MARIFRGRHTRYLASRSPLGADDTVDTETLTRWFRDGLDREFRTPVDLEELLRDAWREVEQKAPDARLDCSPLPAVHMDMLAAMRLVTNLLHAVFTYAGRADLTVAIEAAREPDGWTVLHIRDNGQGIPVALRAEALDPFAWLTHGTTEADEQPSGLPECRRLLQQVGGHLVIGDPDRGLALEFWLPPRAVLSPGLPY